MAKWLGMRNAVKYYSWMILFLLQEWFVDIKIILKKDYFDSMILYYGINNDIFDDINNDIDIIFFVFVVKNIRTWEIVRRIEH